MNVIAVALTNNFDEARSAWDAVQQPNVIFFPDFDTNTSGPLVMSRVVACLGSNLSVRRSFSEGVTVDGEMVVVRTDGTLIKPYAFMVGTSSDGSLHYTGPYKNFPAHHVHPGQRVAPQDFFGHTPASKTKVP